MKRYVVAVLVVAFATPTQARDYYYFHRAGVDRAQYAADRLVCDRLAGGVKRAPAESRMIYVSQPSTLSPGANAASVAIASLFAGLMLGHPERRRAEMVERTCMADKGYGRYRVDKTVAQAADALSAEERLDRYFTMATAATPIGARIKE